MQDNLLRPSASATHHEGGELVYLGQGPGGPGPILGHKTDEMLNKSANEKETLARVTRIFENSRLDCREVTAIGARARIGFGAAGKMTQAGGWVVVMYRGREGICKASFAVKSSAGELTIQTATGTSDRLIGWVRQTVEGLIAQSFQQSIQEKSGKVTRQSI